MSDDTLTHSLRTAIQKVATGPEYSKNLPFEEAHLAMKGILSEDSDPVRAGIYLISLRMKRETDEENKGTLQAILDETKQVVAPVSEVIDIADPYDGQSRGLPASSFLAPVLAACGLHAVVHGLESVGPKYGATHHKVLKAAGKNVLLSPEEARDQVGNPDIGWSYIDQSIFCPALHKLLPLRQRMIKRSVITTVEVLTGPIRGKEKTHLLTGYVHKAYPPIYESLARFAGFDSAMIVRGVEGGVVPSLQQPALMTSYRGGGESSEIELNPVDLGINQTTRATPLPRDLAKAAEKGDEISTEYDPDEIARAAAEAGLAALGGEKGTTYDALVYSGAIALTQLGLADSWNDAAERISEAIDSGEALKRFNAAA
jgi:anthranilate phosphoribosyltransferase